MADQKVTDRNSYAIEDREEEEIGITPEQQKLNEEAFEKAVERLKQEHPGDEMMVNLMTDSAVARAIVAWGNVPREIRIDACDKGDPWEMIWFAPGLWMEAARVPQDLEQSIILCIKQNHLVYPDGTIPDCVRHYLIVSGQSLLGLKPNYKTDGPKPLEEENGEKEENSLEESTEEEDSE